MHMRVNNSSLQYKIMCSELISPAEEPVDYDRQTFLGKHNMKSNFGKRKEDKRENIFHCVCLLHFCNWNMDCS